MTQEVREGYGDEPAAGATTIFQNNEDFVDAAVEFDAARPEKIMAMARLQRERGLTDHAMGNAAEQEEEETEESLARERLQPEINRVD